MIITISGANFGASNIGTLSSYLVRYTGNVTGNVTSVAKNDAGTAAKNALTATITMKSGYTYNSLSVTVNGSTITGYTATDNGNGTVTLTVPANLITGTVVVAVVTTGTSVTPPVTPEQPGTGGGSDTPTYIETTIGSTNYPTKIVSSWEYVDLTINGIISTGGGSNCTINTTSSGRCSNIDYVLQVNGGETISFAPTSLVGSWALTEFKDIPLTKDNFTPNGDASKSWLTGNATLQTATKYIIMNFKKANSGDFTEENIADIKNTITIN